MPPIHPAIIHFPIALMVFSIVADLIGYIKNNNTWRMTGLWTLAASFFTAAIAAVTGVLDMNNATLGDTVHDYVHLHLYFGIILVAAMAALTAWRWLADKPSHTRFGWGYYIAAFLVLSLTLFQGWIGGELVFSHGAGVAAAGQGTEQPAKAAGRLEKISDRLLPIFPAESKEHEEIKTEPTQKNSSPEEQPDSNRKEHKHDHKHNHSDVHNHDQ
ncbi:MAG: DUF2231 domain-containing protein [Acidobacteriota bacterium]